MTGIITNSENIQEVFKRLSESALLGDGEQCQVSKNDLSTILLAYTLELNKNNAAKE